MAKKAATTKRSYAAKTPPSRRAGTVAEPAKKRAPGRAITNRIAALKASGDWQEPMNGKSEANGEAKEEKGKAEVVKVEPIKQTIITVNIYGTTPYMQNKFSQKAFEMMKGKHEAGSQAQVKKTREKRDFKKDCEGATYRLRDGSYGIPATAFRNGCISAGRLINFKMTLLKMAIFIEADGYDKDGMTPLVRIIGKPKQTVMPVRNQTGVCDLRSRPMWEEWSAKLRIRFDETVISKSDLCNLLQRVGAQVGIGEGRPDSKSSNGLGYGLFEVQHEGETKATRKKAAAKSKK